MTPQQYPVLVMCGSDKKRRKLLQELDPDRKYKSKALLPFLGKRVIDWQLEALIQSPYVKDIYLLGLSEEEAQFQYPVQYIPCQTTSSLAEKLQVGLAYLQEEDPGLEVFAVSTSDTPAISTQSINAFFEGMSELQPFEAVISGVPINITEKIFPNHGRVVAHLRDHHLYPGEMFALTPSAVKKGIRVIEALSVRRRRFNRKTNQVSLGPLLRYIARKPGLWLLILKYLLGQLSLPEAERSLSKAFSVQLKAIVIDDPGFGMDMDLPEDYRNLEAYVRKTKAAKMMKM